MTAVNGNINMKVMPMEARAARQHYKITLEDI